MPLTKQDLVEQVYNEIGFPKNQSTEIIGSLFEIIKKTLESGEDVMISGFGKFCIKEKKNGKVGIPPLAKI